MRRVGVVKFAAGAIPIGTLPPLEQRIAQRDAYKNEEQVAPERQSDCLDEDKSDKDDAAPDQSCVARVSNTHPPASHRLSHARHATALPL